MRVTDRMLYENAARDGGLARSRLELATRQASSGIRVEHPEDDPGSAALIAQHRAEADRQTALNGALGTASAELTSVDSVMNGISTELSRAKELAVQMANATYSAADRAAAAAEADGMVKNLLGLLNTRSGQRYIFGGFQDQAPPFDAAGAYLGDTGVRQVEIAPGQLADVSLRADQVFKGVGGGLDVVASLQAFVTALQTNNVAGVQTAVGDLDTGISQVAVARSKVGGQQSLVDAAAAISLAGRDQALKRLAGEADVDAIDAASRLAQAQHALDASLTASATSFKLSLLDKL